MGRACFSAFILEEGKKLKKQRVCLLFDFELYQKLRNIQGDKIKKTNRSVSFSQLVEDLVKNGMKNGKGK